MSNNSLYIVFILITCFANSQVNTNSPYSFYGLGNISQTGFSQNIGMSGISCNKDKPLPPNHHRISIVNIKKQKLICRDVLVFLLIMTPPS